METEEKDKVGGERETFSRHSHENTLVTQSWPKEPGRTKEWLAGVGQGVGQAKG